MKKLIWILCILVIPLTSCDTNLDEIDFWEDWGEGENNENWEEIPEPATQPEPQNTIAPPLDLPSKIDKWDLWTHGTQLRGANTWQRVISPRYDGEDFLGSGHVGPPYTQEDFNKLAAQGANYVNFSHPGLFTERPPYRLDPLVEANLDNMIAMAANADLFVVITFRTGPGRNDFTFYRDDNWFKKKDLIENIWEDTDAQAAWAEMWQYTAERYRNNPVVIGYDLMCEPNSNEILDEWDQDQFETRYGGTTYDWNAWYPNLVTAIRQVDPDTPILVGGNAYSALDWLPYIKTINADRIIYMFHQYAPFMFTHQDPDENLTYPGQFDTDYDGEKENFNRTWLEEFLSIAEDFANQNGVVVAVNEYGVDRWVTGSAAFMDDQMAIFEELGINYALWIWDPVWQPWNDEVNSMNFRYGPVPENTTSTPNDLQSIIQKYWSLNTVHPSDFYMEE